MARRRQKQNPNNGGMIAMLAVVGIGVYGWMNGWFTTQTVVATPTPAPTPTNNPIMNPATQIVNAPSTPPPLGTVVGNANDIAAQAAAGLAYILPVQTIGNLTSLTPNGYSPITTSDYGTIFLRNNVYSVANTDLQNRINRAQASGASATSVQASTQLALNQIQQDMANNGIAGLGYSRTGIGWA